MIARVRKQLGLSIRNQDGVFVMGAKAAIGSHDRPAVAQRFDMIVASCNHRLNGDRHTATKPHAMSRDAVVGHLGILVHLPSDAMTTERAYRGESAVFDVLLNCMADITDSVAFARDFERFEEAFFRDINQTLCFGRNLSDARGKRAVGLPSVENQTTVD